MAERKKNTKTSKNTPPRGAQAMVIFWLIFVLVIVGVYMAKAPVIKKNFNLFKTWITSSPDTEELPDEGEETVVQDKPPAKQEATPQKPILEPAKQDKPQPLQEKPAVTPKQQKPEVKTDNNPPDGNPKTPSKPAETRDRNIYFAQIDKDGQILQSKVTRKIPVSASPMVDTLNVMLAGPSSGELNKGLLNFIPQNTRIISATVRGSTAYINFSEDFLFNKFGVEGYVAQLRQIVWTVTEFSNISDVQILIEGRRLDYLGEGIWIGSPINRQSF